MSDIDIKMKYVSTFGGAFFIPVSEVRAVPMGNHIHLDITGKPSLSKEHVYVQPQLETLLQNGTTFPDSVLQAGGMTYKLVRGAADTNRVMTKMPDGKDAVVCFRSIAGMLGSCGPDQFWITFGTIGDVIENCNAEVVVFDPGLPTANAVPISVIKQALNQVEKEATTKSDVAKKEAEKKKSLLGKLFGKKDS